MNNRQWLEKLFWFAMGLLVATMVSWIHPDTAPWGTLLSLFILIATTWRLIFHRKSLPSQSTPHKFSPKSKHYKQIQKIEKKRQKRDQDKHNTISDQIRYVESKWGYSKTQQRVIDDFLAKEAYRDIYNRLNASLLPQLIAMIEQCLNQEQKGCKRAVAKRIRVVVALMKSELRKQKSHKKEKLEMTIEVYDKLLNESY